MLEVRPLHFQQEENMDTPDNAGSGPLRGQRFSDTDLRRFFAPYRLEWLPYFGAGAHEELAQAPEEGDRANEAPILPGGGIR